LTVMILENIERKYLRNIPAFEYFKFFQGSWVGALLLSEIYEFLSEVATVRLLGLQPWRWRQCVSS
jgi:hypothetical protein